ncbi:hypothetical protein D3C81_1330560 [compost metagenome]
MADHHALGEAGGAAGVENPQQGIAATAHVFYRRRFGQQRFVIEHAWRGFTVAGINDMAYGFGLAGNQRALVLEGIVDDQQG